jgi:hypothetical protein
MEWSRLLFVLGFLVLIPVIGLNIVFRLPMLCCHQLRTVRWLAPAGLCYYSAAVALVGTLAGWNFAALLCVMVLFADWLLPNPVLFVFRPAWRRAALRAVEYVEQQGGPRPMYWRVYPAGYDNGRPVVALGVGGAFRPGPTPAWRFLAVGPGGAVEELGPAEELGLG